MDDGKSAKEQVMGMIERLKAQDARISELDKRVQVLEAALNELLASLSQEEDAEDEKIQLLTLDGASYESGERDQSESL